MSIARQQTTKLRITIAAKLGFMIFSTDDTKAYTRSTETLQGKCS